MLINQPDGGLDCLMLVVFSRTPGVMLLIEENESLSTSLFDMLKQGSDKGDYFFLEY